MSNYSFSDKQRHALFTVHGGKCYLCSEMIDLISMEVDHIISERLDGESELNEVIELYGLPLDFDVNTYDNWLPSCRSCNGKKGGRVFKTSLLLQRELEFASEKAGKCLEAEKTITNNKWISRSFNYLKRAHENGSLGVEEY
jgi:5-methylcytosine-specific restriction endonuclease McrA